MERESDSTNNESAAPATAPSSSYQAIIRQTAH